MKLKHVILFLATCILASHSYAAKAVIGTAKKGSTKVASTGFRPPKVTSSSMSLLAKAPQVSPWSASVDITRSASLYDLKNGAKYDGMDYGAGVGYAFSFGSVSTKLSLTQVLSPTDEDTTTLNDSYVSYSHKGTKLYEDARAVNVSWAPSATIILPLSIRSQKVDQMQTAIIAASTLKVAAGEEAALSGLGMGISISVGQNFHQFETDQNGTIMNRLSSNQSVSLSYAIGDFSAAISYANKIRWPYSGDLRTSFEFTQEVAYKFQKSWTLSLGHSNSGSALKPNGYDSNVSVISEDNSIVYFGIAYGI